MGNEAGKGKGKGSKVGAVMALGEGVDREVAGVVGK